MKKPQLILVAGSAVSAILVILAACYTVASLNKAGADKKKVNREFSSLENLYRTADPFPTRDNIEIARKNQEETLVRVESLKGLLAQGVSDENEKLTPGQFSQLREETIRALVKDAPAGEGGLPVVDPENVFGFDRYNEGQPASKAQVPRLVRQLRLTDMLVRKFYAAGILHLDAVGREVFEEAEAETAASAESSESGFGRRPRRNKGQAANTNKKVTSIKVPLAPFGSEHGLDIDRQRFGFVFSTREAGLRNVLDTLDGMWPYVMVSGLSFQKTLPDVVFPDDDNSSKAKASDKKAEESVSTTPGIKEKPAPRTARLVSGPQFEAPVTVTMFVDVYRFPPKAESSATDTPAEEEEPEEEM